MRPRGCRRGMRNGRGNYGLFLVRTRYYRAQWSASIANGFPGIAPALCRVLSTRNDGPSVTLMAKDRIEPGNTDFHWSRFRQTARNTRVEVSHRRGLSIEIRCKFPSQYPELDPWEEGGIGYTASIS